MRKTDYEILVIVKPHLNDEDYEKMQTNMQNWIEKKEGGLLFMKALGLRDLATPIKKIKNGFYIQAHFSATNKTLQELKRRLGVDENVMRYMIVTLDSIEIRNAPATE